MTEGTVNKETAGPAPEPSMPSGEIDHEEKVTDLALRALKDRPKFSIRMQIYVALVLSFVIFLGIAVALLITTYMIEKKVSLLEISNSYLFEIQQARRFEKNYFLYGTNLTDSLENIYNARRILLDNSDRLEEVMGKESLAVILSHLEQYENQLGTLENIERNPDAEDYFWRKKDAEVEVRKHGQEMVSFAQDLMQKEKKALDNMIVLSRRVHIYSFMFLFLLFVFNTLVMGWRVLAPLRRFRSYAERIAEGDYSPIMPARRYRDEFSNLAMGFNHMISELERRQDILVETHKLRAVGTLTAGVAHELNNPINNISLTAHMLLEDYRNLPDDERLDMINDLISEVGRTQTIVRNLLDFARESESKMGPLDLEGVIKGTLALAGNQIAIAGIHTDVKIMPHLPRVHGDRQQLEQVFLNLILNAVDVTPRGGRIQILVIPADEPNFLAVKVTDYGPGIPDHILPSIFDPFFTTKSKAKGTGLGLSICQGIVAKHGGRISVNTKVNAGTTFAVLLPATTFPADLRRVAST
ncbi:MAG: HAMP domain-containing histidine kinase [Candidatus Hydrogenedentota bacterium]|nr:MAG: HAMP domain-containing histidine kinase [Candidatus Hydrogenedentota bacterium]